MPGWDKKRADILDELASASLAGSDFDIIFEKLCVMLVDAGVGIARGHVSTTALHPLINAVGVTWERETKMIRENYKHGGMNELAFQESPFNHILQNRLEELHLTLETEERILEFPILLSFRRSGLTDWIAFRRDFGWTGEHLPFGTLGMVVSWATDRTGGFGEHDRARLRSLTTALASAVRARVVQDLSRDVLAAYLGADAASKVMAGAITRGSVTDIFAAVMLADIRGFTALSETSSRSDVVALLNATFNAAAAPIAEGNGQILKFMGDGFLAVFPIEEDRQAAMRAAFRSAQEIQLALQPNVKMDIALHVGHVHYGNIGASERLDFTVIGSVVNEVARIEGLCSQLEQPLLLSEDAAELLGFENVVSVGSHSLKGIKSLKTIYAPRM